MMLLRTLRLLSVTISMMAVNAMAQHSLFITSGYGFPTNATLLEVNSQVDKYNIETHEVVYGSYGKGYKYTLGYSYSLKKQFELDAKFERSVGSSYSSSFSQDISETSSNSFAKAHESTNAKIWLAGISVKLKTNSFAKNKTCFFISGGPVVAFGKLFSETKYEEGTSEPITIQYNEESTGTTSWGAQVAVGVEHTIHKRISLIGTIRYTALSFTPKKSSFTTFQIDGQDWLGNLPTNEKETIYLDKITVVANAPQSPDMPRAELRSSYPLNNLSMELGLKVRLFGK